MKDEALRIALEALEKISKTMYHIETPPVESLEEQMRRIAYKAITAIKQPPAQPAPVQDSTCNETLRAQGNAYPRTCRKCGLGPCIGAPKQPPAQPAPVQVAGPSGDCLSDFQEGQWWLAELDAVVANGTHEQKRAMAVVRNLLATVAANTTPPAQPAPVQEPEIVQRVKRYAGQTMRTARNPNITARECIELANWIAGGQPAAKPAVPDALTSADIQEHIEYVAGWNDCRAEMLKGMK